MPSYMSIVVLALAASNVPIVLSAPVPSFKVPEQSPSRRKDPSGPPPPSSGDPVQPSHPLSVGWTPKETHEKAIAKEKRGIQDTASNFVLGVMSVISAASLLKWVSNHPIHKSSAPAASPTSPISQTGPPQNYGSNYIPNQYQGQNQRRVDDHDHATLDNGFGSSEAEAKPISDNDRRAASLLSGADLEEASRLFSRIPDELD